MQNSKSPTNKISNLIKTINKIIYSIMALQVLIIFIFGYLSLKWQKEHIGIYDFAVIVIIFIFI